MGESTQEHPHALRLDTSMPTEELDRRLQEWSPWGHRIEFSNGLSTADYPRRTPFNDAPLQKLALVADSIPLGELRGAAALDIGCNSGYVTAELASRYGMDVTGIDVVPRHLEVSQFIAGSTGADVELVRASAEEFHRPGEYRLITHFGTLYHLPNPLRALELCFDNLQEDGWLALETQCYDHPDDPSLCYWMRGHNDDLSNYWALSSSVLVESLHLYGFTDVHEVLRVSPPSLAQHMNRVILVAHKPAAAEG